MICHIHSVALYVASMAEVGQGRTLTRVEITAIAWAINICSGIINTIGTKAIGRMSMFNVWWTLGGTVVLVITLLVKAPTKVSSANLHFSSLHAKCGPLIEFCPFRVHGFPKVSALILRTRVIVTGRLVLPVGNQPDL
jgi:amino acid transporter